MWGFRPDVLSIKGNRREQESYIRPFSFALYVHEVQKLASRSLAIYHFIPFLSWHRVFSLP